MPVSKVKSPLLVTPEQMKAAERYTEDGGTSCAVLMDNVGRETAEGLSDIVGAGGKNIVILCGSGNNGGDGFAAGKYLSRKNAKVTVVLVSGQPKTDLAKQCFDRCLPYFGSVSDYGENPDKAIKAISDADVILDCVYGTGFHGELTDSVAGLFKCCNESGAFKASVDVASGCNALTGEVCEDAFCADVTFAAGAVKAGQIIQPAAELSGEIITLEIGIKGYPEYIAEINNDGLLGLLPRRKRFSHKGTFGRLLNVAGSDSFPGAAWLSTHAAMRIGVGIVTLASVKGVTDTVAATLHECTFLPLKNGAGYIDEEDIKDIVKAARSATAVTVGCGMGDREDTRLTVKALVENTNCPIVIDADGINSLSGHIHELKDNTNRLLFTPHPKEFSRISGLSVEEILRDPVGAARSFAIEQGVYLLLKGAYSVIAAPDGRLAVNMSGNAALAKGGSGDCLTGTIGGLLAQGLSPWNAARLGAYIAGLAAEKAAETRAMSGILPGELADLYPYILK
ncbi:MAG: NAD(P)H-hydrate dehydratase [Eubacterium sp.]|nr:NAD(P)H-hydrate dehydratase [Eubacterium sp.]